ncbi:methyltransferase domain protein [Mycobacterium xenopi 3993]|nr:methyltransferase domain protein [Mycobacterium xenopi 3993]
MAGQDKSSARRGKLRSARSAARPAAAEARLTGRRHSRRRDRAAIAHHYDLSNEFYRLLLDEQMTYSSAYFTHDGQSLDEAQTAKLDLICRKLDLRPGMRLLDVGCGWGSLICYAATHYGVHATGITLSQQQRDFIAGRLAERRVDNVDVRLLDYRDFDALPGTSESFDAVSSIEMGEHVGEKRYLDYARMLFRALTPTGRLLLQQMSRRSDAAPGGGPFIERYIAPDMHMRPLAHTLSYLEKAGFEVRDVEAMREHYARTARHWIETFDKHYDQFVALQGDQAARVWRLYLVGGALAFEQGRMGVDQILAVKPTADGQAAMPWTRLGRRRRHSPRTEGVDQGARDLPVRQTVLAQQVGAGAVVDEPGRQPEHADRDIHAGVSQFQSKPSTHTADANVVLDGGHQAIVTGHGHQGRVHRQQEARVDDGDPDAVGGGPRGHPQREGRHRPTPTSSTSRVWAGRARRHRQRFPAL